MKRKTDFLFYMIPVVLAAVLLVSGGLFLREYLSYRQADGEYAALEAYIQPETENAAPETAEKETAAGAAGEASVPQDTEGMAFPPALAVDYAALRVKNGDFFAVLSVPALDLVYPVVKPADNEKYLTTTFDGTHNPAGCIFMDCIASPDLTDPNTFIFGHNMKNLSMFGKLKLLLKDASPLNTCPYVFLYTENKIYCYKIFSAYGTTVESSAYDLFTGEDGYDAYVKQAAAASQLSGFRADADFIGRPPMITLSTCAGTQHTGRTLVHAVLEATVEN